MTPFDLFHALMFFLFTMTTSGPLMSCDTWPPTECVIVNESNIPRTAAVFTVDGITYEVLPDYEINEGDLP